MAETPKKSLQRDLSQLEREYNALRPLLSQLHDELLRQLAQLLEQARVALSFPVQHRVKTWSSVVEKLQRVPLALSSLRGMQDLVGFRIILQFRRDVEHVCSLIEAQLRIVNRYDTVRRLKENQFGYSSIHFVVEVPTAWLAVPTMAGLAGLHAEIQVRTTAQHIWAEASQTLQYKSQESVPSTLNRAIYRVSALLETVDLEFERLLLDRAAYKAEVALATPSEEPLNSDTLERVLDESWPTGSDNTIHDLVGLLADLIAMGVLTPRALSKLIAKWRDVAMEFDRNTAAKHRASMDLFAGIPGLRERIMTGRYFTRAGLTRFVLSKEFPAEWLSRHPNAFRDDPMKTKEDSP